MRRIQTLIKQAEEENIYQQYPLPGVEELDQPEPFPLKKDNEPTMYNISNYQPTLVSMEEKIFAPEIIFDSDEPFDQEIQFPDELKIQLNEDENFN